MIPYTADVGLRTVFRDFSRVGLKGHLDFYGMSDPSNPNLFVPYAFCVRLEDETRQCSTRIYEFAAKRVPLKCRGVPILDVSIFRKGNEVYHERRFNAHLDRLV